VPPARGACTRAGQPQTQTCLWPPRAALHTGTREPRGGALHTGRRRTTTKRCCVPSRAQSRRRRSMGHVKTWCPPRQRGPVARAGGFLLPPMRAWLEQPHGRHHKAPPQPCALTTTGWLLPLQMGKRVSERATRGGEGRNTAVSGHRIHVVRLGKPSEPVRTRRLRSLGARVLGGSSAW